jgi:AcrR family transcriptional regulator
MTGAEVVTDQKVTRAPALDNPEELLEPADPRGPRPRGRRPGSSDTRQKIADSAQHLFAECGYDAVSVRSIALAADVDPAMVLYFFGSKRELFESLVQLPVAPSVTLEMLAPGVDGLGRRIARFVVDHLSTCDGREKIVSLLRTAGTDAEAAQVLRERYLRELLEPLAAALHTDRPELRAALCSSQLVGLAVARHVIGLPALVDTEPDTLVEIYGATLQHYLTGPLSP